MQMIYYDNDDNDDDDDDHHHHYQHHCIIIIIIIISGAPRAKRACGAPWVNKSTHPRKFGNHVTDRPTVRPHHRHTNVYSRTF